MAPAQFPALRRFDIRSGQARSGTEYFAHDRVSGKIYRISAEIAGAVQRAKTLGPKARLAEDDTAALRAAHDFSTRIALLERRERDKTRVFNPVFARIPLIELAWMQRHLRGLADLVFGRAAAVVLGIALVLAFYVGSEAQWQIGGAFSGALSLQGLATFAVIAPLLKIIHEFGHILAATRAGVPVRDGGLFLIGLYPMPYVDVSDADVMATRRGRIGISLAGIAVDLSVALAAFFAWHGVEGGFLKTVIGNVFVFSSLNSVLFNANPLIKLDGYFALADALGRRNLYTDAGVAAVAMRRKITSFGAEGAWPEGRGAAGLAAFGFAALIYRVNMLIGIAWILLPKFLGLGAVVVAWGGWVMFLSPLLRATPAAPNPGSGTIRRRRSAFWALAFAAMAAIAMIERPFVATIPVQLDPETYGISAKTGGVIAFRHPGGPVEPGTVLIRMRDPGLAARHLVADMEAATARTRIAGFAGTDPARHAVALEALTAAEARVADLAARIAALEIRAPSAGLFAADAALVRGSYRGDGAVLAAFHPATGRAILTGPFPEAHITHFDTSAPRTTLRVDDGFIDTPGRAVLETVVTLDQETGARNYRLVIPVAETPAQLRGRALLLRVEMAPAPLWQHGAHWIRQIKQRFRDAQLSEMEARL